MARVRQIYEYRYRDGVLSRSIAYSWRPAKWHLGADSAAYVANGPARVLLLPSVYLTIITPQGEILILEATRPNDVARAHQLAAEINRDAVLSAGPSYYGGHGPDTSRVPHASWNGSADAHGVHTRRADTDA